MGSKVVLLSEVSAAAVIGGAERVLREQALSLHQAGHEVALVARAPSGDARAEVAVGPCLERRYHPSRQGDHAFVFSSLTGATRAFDVARNGGLVDATIIHQSLAGLGPILRRRRAAQGWLYVCHSLAHEEYLTRRDPALSRTDRLRVGLAARARRWIERAVMRRCSLVLVLSEFMRRRVIDTHGIAAPKIRVVPGAADLERFSPPSDRAAVRQELKLPAGKVLLFTVRNLVPRMGLDTLLHAIAALGDEARALLLLIGGDGPLRASLQQAIADLGLAGTVQLTGFIPEQALPKFYQAADVVLMPTQQLEGFGLVTVEALACGTPVLGTPVGAIPEILTPLDPELVTDGADAASLAKGLRRLLRRFRDDPSERDRLATTCRAYVEQHYAWERHARELELLLHEMRSRADAGTGGR